MKKLLNIAVWVLVAVLIWLTPIGRFTHPRTTCDSECCPHNAPAQTNAPSASDTFEIGPESHPGFNDMAEPETDSQLDIAIRALIHVESGGNPNAIGDRHLTNKAYGILQIRKPYLADVNRLFKADIKAKWGKSQLTATDTKDPARARWVAEKYLGHYEVAYTRKTGKKPTAVIYARIHNGGPSGWQRTSTNSHARKVEKAIERMGL